MENPIKGRESFMEGFEVISRLIQRYVIVERIYSKTVDHSMEDRKQEGGKRDLEEAITRLYSCILVYQARALRHLDHRKVRRVLSDTFKPQQWEDLLQKIKKQEKECDKLGKTLDQELLRNGFAEQSSRITTLGEKLMSSFKDQLDNIKVTSSGCYLIKDADPPSRTSKI